MCAETSQTMYDPDAPDSPHLGGAQPTWGNLPFACELIHSYWQASDKKPKEVDNRLLDHTTPSTLGDIRNLMKKLDFLDDGHNLLPNGVWLAENFLESDQTTIGDTATFQVGTKQSLSGTEQIIFKTILFEKDWLPMLATINQLATEDVETKETVERAESFRERVDHLTKYQSVNEINSWRKKAQAHYQWVNQVELATVIDGYLRLTENGQSLHTQLSRHYHPDWPQKD